MSQSSTSWNGDIGTRYERLAAEYSKLRAQATVLKKGVLEERAKNEKLTEDLKATESVTRKLRSENESLTFRNEQLLKRVHNVQDELEESQRASSGGKKKEKRRDGPSEREQQLETSLAILEEELRGKLTANERLTNKLEEFSSLNEMLTLQLRELKERIEEMDKNGKGLQPRMKQPANMVENGSSASPISGRPSSPSVSSVQSSSTAISDSPLWQIAESGRGILSGLSTLLSLLEQRVRIFPYDASLEKLPPHVEQLGSLLGEASKLFAAADEVANRLFDEPADKWKQSTSAILSSIDEAVKYCEEKLPSLLTSIAQEESRCPWSDSALEALNERWRLSLCCLLSSLSSLSPSILSSLDGNPQSLSALSKTVNALHMAIKGTQESFSARWLIETRLPVQTKKGKCVGTATRDSLLKMLGVSQRVTSRLSGVMKEMEEREEVERRMREEERREREEEEDEDIRSEEETPVPVAVVDSSPDLSVVHRKDSMRSTKSSKSQSPKREEKEKEQRSARKQTELYHLRLRVSELEGEREKMMLDLALLRRKLVAGGTTVSDDSASSVQSAAVAAEIERHYRGRLREMAEKAIESAARGDYYSKECESLVRSARCMQNEKKKLEDEIEAMTREKLALFDELRTTQYGYESKLREMSDHVAMLNTEKEEREKEKEKEKNQKNTLSRRLTLFK